MSETNHYYVRYRGKTSGPYSGKDLVRMVKRGQVSRMHQVSSDQVEWRRGSELNEWLGDDAALFTEEAKPLDRVHAQVHSTGDLVNEFPTDAGEHDAEDGAEESTEPEAYITTPPHQHWYVEVDGNQIGPLEDSQVRAMFSQGRIDGYTLVWREGYESWVSLQSTGLVPHTPRAGEQISEPRQSRTKKKEANDDRRVTEAGTLVGCMMGGMLLLCLNIPLVVESEAFWWWDMMENPAVGISILGLLLGGISLCIVSPLTSKLARSIYMMSLASLGVIFIIASMISAEAMTSEVALILILLISSFGLHAVCRFRKYAPQVQYGKILCGIIGGIVLGLSLIGGIVILLGLAETIGEGVQWPASFTAGVVALVLFCMAIAAAGICSLISLQRKFVAGLNDAVIWLLKSGLLLVFISPILIFAGFLDALSGFAGISASDPALLQFYLLIARAMLIIIVIMVVFERGLFEQFYWQWRAKKQG